ncbi:hypothetical protein GCM10028821_26580 [Hymenobacter jeollabukensis]
MGAGWAQNVGIGTTAPTQKLDVNGNVRVRAAAGTGDGRLLGVEADGTLKVQPPLFGAAATPSPQAPALVGSAAATDGEPVKVLLNPAGTRAYVLTRVSLTNPAGQKRASLQVFDVSGPTPAPVGSPVLTVAGGIDMALNQAGTRVWVLGYEPGSSNGFIQGFDLSQGQPVALGGEAPVGYSPQTIAVNPTGTRAFVWDSTQELVTFDLSQGGTPVQLNALPVAWIQDLAVNLAGTRLYAVDGSQELTTYDISSGLPVAVGSSVTTSGYSDELAVSPSGTRLYLLSSAPSMLSSYDISSGLPVAVGTPVAAGTYYSYGLVNSANGAVLAVQNFIDGTLLVYDVNGSGLPVARAAAPGITGGGLALSPDGSRAYLTYAGNTLRTVLLAAPRVLAVGSDGSLGSVDPALFKDNLGDHTATRNLNLAGKLLVSGGSQGLALDKDGNVGIGTGRFLDYAPPRLGIFGSSASQGVETIVRLTRPYQGAKVASVAEWRLGSFSADNASASRLDLALQYSSVFGTGFATVLSAQSNGRIGLSTTEPASQLANTNLNIIGSDQLGINEKSLTWLHDNQGYAAAVGNTLAGYGGNGLAVKVADSGSNTTALDVSQGPGVSTAGTTLLRVRADGNVGIGTGGPSARLDVAGSTRLRGLTTAGIVTTDANGNLSSAAASTLGDNLGNHLATRNLSLGAFQLVGNGGTAGLSISSGGSVGIGTASPAAPLHVATGAVPAAVLEGSNAGPHLELRKPGAGLANIDYIGTDFGGTRGGALELRGASSVQLSGDGDPSSPDLTVLANGRVGVGTTAPRGLLDVAGTGDSYLVPDPNNGSSQSLFLPGHLWLTPFSGNSGMAYLQARVPNASASTRIGLTLRTTNGTSLVDALTLAADGTAALAGPLTAPAVTTTTLTATTANATTVNATTVTTSAVTSPATGTANMVAAGYGNVFGVGTLSSASANVTVAHAGPGEYVLTFTGPLATADLGSRAVALTLYNGPGFISFVSGSGPGKLLVRTYNTGGTLTDRGFSFVIFQP